MIFKRLKKSTKEEEEQFSMMLEEEKVGWKDKLAMLIAAFFTINENIKAEFDKAGVEMTYPHLNVHMDK